MGSNGTGPAGATSLTAAWLSSRLGVDRIRLERMAQSGALLAYSANGSYERRFPAWQFDGGAKPIPALEQIREAARRAGLDDDRLCAVMERRVGLGGRERLRDLARNGRLPHVLACIEQAARERRS